MGVSADERPILVDQIEARAVDQQIVAQFLILRALARGQRLVEHQRFGIILTPVNAFKVARRVHQFGDQFLFARREPGGMKRHIDATKLRQPLRQVRDNLQTT
jgi:hypothetical protein